MKGITTTINGQSVSINYDHHYSNIYCVDVYINDSYKVDESLDKKTRLAITKWVLLQIKEAVKQGNCLCACPHDSDNKGDARTKMFIKAGFKQAANSLYYLR